MIALIECSICHKADVEFSAANKYTCKGCAKYRSKLWYEANKPRREKYSRDKLKERKLWAVQLMGGNCQDCGNEYPPCVYDFHHLDDTKEMNPSVALRMSEERAKKELEKCVLLCANCHRRRHFC